MNAIQIQKVQAGYHNHVVIDALDLTLEKGKITSIIGPNGCGKSTLLKTVGRILTPTCGQVLLEGRDIHKTPTTELAKAMAILPQTPLAPEGLLVEELVAYGRFPHNKGFKRLTEADYEVVHWALEATGLYALREQPVDELSGGQRQRVWIAMALAQQTGIILLDEPTTYLDMAYQLEVLLLLEQLNRDHGTTIVMVLHDLNLAARFSHHMVAMRSGALIAAGTPDEVMTPAVLNSVYDIEAYIARDPVTHKKICQTYFLTSNTLKREKGA